MSQGYEYCKDCHYVTWHAGSPQSVRCCICELRVVEENVKKYNRRYESSTS